MVKDTYPLRRGHSGEAPQEVVNAVRTVLEGWDGKNWDAVRHCLYRTYEGKVDLDDWTMSDIRQHFAIGQRPMILKLGGKVNTTEAIITPTKWNTVEVMTTDPADQSWPTITQVADGLNENKGTVSRLIASGDLRDNGKIGTPRRIDPASVLEYCKAKGVTYNDS